MAGDGPTGRKTRQAGEKDMQENLALPNSIEKKASKSAIRRVASLATNWLLLSALLALVFTLAAIELVTLGALFVDSILIACALALLFGALLTLATEYNKAEATTSSKDQRFTRKQVVLIIVTVALVWLATITAVAVRHEYEEQTNVRRAEEARSRFLVTTHYTEQKVDKEAENQTLRELEDGYQRLKDNWTLPELADKIEVSLFLDLEDYQTKTGRPLAGGHANCRFGPSIFIPLEEPPRSTNDDELSRTPMHEMVHAMMCMSLGHDAFYSVPRWFHEGMAGRYEMEGLSRIWNRIERRIWLWSKRPILLDTTKFCNTWRTPEDAMERALLYETSREFIYSLEAEHGSDNLHLIIDDVRKRVGFDESMGMRLGGDCSELYSEWKASL